jgi:hypothetical protein
MLKDDSSAVGSPAIILYIVTFQDAGSAKTLLGVQRLKPFAAQHDPFSTFPLLHTSLHLSLTNNSALEFVSLGHIKSHFASLEMHWDGQPVTVVTSLDRG